MVPLVVKNPNFSQISVCRPSLSTVEKEYAPTGGAQGFLLFERQYSRIAFEKQNNRIVFEKQYTRIATRIS